MQPTAPNKWSGQIYNADDGKTYQANVTLVSDNAMALPVAAARGPGKMACRTG